MTNDLIAATSLTAMIMRTMSCVADVIYHQIVFSEVAIMMMLLASRLPTHSTTMTSPSCALCLFVVLCFTEHLHEVDLSDQRSDGVQRTTRTVYLHEVEIFLQCLYLLFGHENLAMPVVINTL